MRGQVLDLARERRTRRGFAELHALLDDDKLAERTRKMLNGEIPCPDLEGDMAERELQSVRLPADLMERAEALVPLMEKDSELAAFGRVTKSAVVRVALLRGLDSLDSQYKSGAAKRRKR